MDLYSNKIKESIGRIPDYPEEGIVFRDLTTWLKQPSSLHDFMYAFVGEQKVNPNEYDVVCGIDARGFDFASILAYDFNNLSYVKARKKGKLPRETIYEKYELEYGHNELEIQIEDIPKGSNVLIIDDVLATGGTAKAVGDLIERLGGKVGAFGFVAEIGGLEGRKLLEDRGWKVYSICKFDEND